MPNDCDVVALHMRSELWVNADGVNRKSNMSRAVHEVLVGVGEFVVVAVVSIMLKHRDDVTVLRQVCSDGAIEKMPTACAMRDHGKWERAISNRSIRAGVDRIWTKERW